MARYKMEQREMAYRIYVTDCLQLSPQSKYRTDRFADFLIGKEMENRSAEEIAADIIKRAGLSFKKVN